MRQIQYLKTFPQGEHIKVVIQIQHLTFLEDGFMLRIDQKDLAFPREDEQIA